MPVHLHLCRGQILRPGLSAATALTATQIGGPVPETTGLNSSTQVFPDSRSCLSYLVGSRLTLLETVLKQVEEPGPAN